MEELQKQLQELSSKIATLEADNSTLKSELRAHDLEEYKKAFNALSNALEKGDALEIDFQNTWTNVLKDELYQDLLRINNPTSEGLGFKFTDVITREVTNTITSKLQLEGEDGEKTKTLWNNLVTRVTANNGLISSVLKSNPITATVSSIVGAAANFFRTKVQEKFKNGNPNKLIGVASETMEVIHQEKIDEFVDRMLPYIKFYDRLLQISNEYEADLEKLKEKFSSIKDASSGYHKRLIQELEFRKDGLTNQLTDLFEGSASRPPGENVPLKPILKKVRIQKGLRFTLNFTILSQEVEMFKRSYNAIYRKFLEGYKDCLANELPSNNDNSFDPNQVRSIQTKIDNALDTIGSGNGFTISQ